MIISSHSHIPVLILLSNMYKFKNVLEIGSGQYSTPMFLNKEIFPYLEHLTSIESDPKWLESTRQLIDKNELRVEFRPSVPVSFFDYDLIFIDGPQDEVKRFKTIGFVMRDIISAHIVIHDMENRVYKKAINKVYYDHIFTGAIKPHTGVYHKNPLPTKEFKNLTWKIQYNFSKIQEGDWKSWKTLLR